LHNTAYSLEMTHCVGDAVGSIDMGIDLWVDRGTFPPAFWSGADALCFVPLLFRGRHFLY